MRGRTITPKVMIPLGEAKTPSQDSPHSFFVIITISQLKIRIKIPNLLAKIMQNRFRGHNNRITVNDHDDHEPKRTNPRKVLVQRKGFPIFTNVFGNKKSSVCKMQAKVIGKNVKKAGVGFTEGRSNKTEHKANICGRHDKRVCVANGRVSSAVMVGGKRESSGKLIKVSSKVVLTQRRSIRVRSLSKVFCKAGSELKCIKATREGESLELCKKRILMGRKCKPLNISGTLLYDKNGILIPEVLP